MKLILCTHCSDVVKLRQSRTSCECGKCWGWYVNDIEAIINKEAIPLGFSNPSLVAAIKRRPSKGLGSQFEAFVIPDKCGSITIED